MPMASLARAGRRPTISFRSHGTGSSSRRIALAASCCSQQVGPYRVPTSIAPELFEFDSADHCYVKRQPTSHTEMEKALRLLRTQELDCVRYRGTDERTLRRLNRYRSRDGATNSGTPPS